MASAPRRTRIYGGLLQCSGAFGDQPLEMAGFVVRVGMASRWYATFVVCFWLASMSWLAASKLLPPLIGGRAPDYRTVLVEAPKQPPPVAWRIIWEQRPVGYAVTRIRPSPGGAEMRSLVHFEQLEVRRILEQLLGGLAQLLPSLGEEGFHLDLKIASRLQFNDQHLLRTIDAAIAVADTPHVLNLHGVVGESNTLDVVAFAGSRFPDASGGEDLLRHQFNLPRDVLVGDAFAPSSELKNLTVGQTWTIPVYRPFPPNSPVQIIEAKAERLELLYWNGETVEVMLVLYRGDAGSGIAATRQPTGRVWVRPDGVVLRQEVMVSSLRLVFERIADGEEVTKLAHSLDDENFLPLLPEGLPSATKSVAND